MPDQVHMLISNPPKLAVSRLVGYIREQDQKDQRLNQLEFPLNNPIQNESESRFERLTFEEPPVYPEDHYSMIHQLLCSIRRARSRPLNGLPFQFAPKTVKPILNAGRVRGKDSDFPPTVKVIFSKSARARMVDQACGGTGN